jgi:hypothetical protein
MPLRRNNRHQRRPEGDTSAAAASAGEAESSLPVEQTTPPPAIPSLPHSQDPRPPPRHFSEVLLDLRQTFEIGEPDPEYEDSEDCRNCGRDSSCEELSADDDGDDGKDQYSRGGRLEQILWPPEMLQIPQPTRFHKHRRGPRHEERLQGDDGNDEGGAGGFGEERIWEEDCASAPRVEFGMRAGVKEGAEFDFGTASAVREGTGCGFHIDPGWGAGEPGEGEVEYDPGDGQGEGDGQGRGVGQGGGLVMEGRVMGCPKQLNDGGFHYKKGQLNLVRAIVKSLWKFQMKVMKMMRRWMTMGYLCQ